MKKPIPKKRRMFKKNVIRVWQFSPIHSIMMRVVETSRGPSLETRLKHGDKRWRCVKSLWAFSDGEYCHYVDPDTKETLAKLEQPKL